jgi:hypothetical protein
MRKKIAFFPAAIIIAVILLVPGCSTSKIIGLTGNSPPESKTLWTEIAAAESPLSPELKRIGKDIELKGFGQLLAFAEGPADTSMLALAAQAEVVSIYLIDLRNIEVKNLGALMLKGPTPVLEAYAWPWVLLGAAEEGGAHSWVLLDVSGEQLEIAWQGSAWVPPGLRRQPLWYNGESWYMGPVAGPYFTDILSGKSISTVPEGINPVKNAWPSWAGGAAGSHWCLLPEEDGSLLQNLQSGAKISLPYNQEMVWNSDKTLLAWHQDDSLGLVDTAGETRVLISSGVVPQSPLWSDSGEKLYFLGGDRDCFGTCSKELWFWEENASPVRLFTLPGNWPQWRLLAATDDAVLGRAGCNGELLVYFDVAAGIKYELKSDAYKWQDGALIALYEGKLVQISPASGSRVILKDTQGFEIFTLVNRYLIYFMDGVVYIKQLIM